MKPELNQTQAIYPSQGPKPKVCVTTAITRVMLGRLNRGFTSVVNISLQLPFDLIVNSPLSLLHVSL